MVLSGYDAKGNIPKLSFDHLIGFKSVKRMSERLSREDSTNKNRLEFYIRNVEF